MDIKAATRQQLLEEQDRLLRQIESLEQKAISISKDMSRWRSEPALTDSMELGDFAAHKIGQTPESIYSRYLQSETAKLSEELSAVNLELLKRNFGIRWHLDWERSSEIAGPKLTRNRWRVAIVGGLALSAAIYFMLSRVLPNETSNKDVVLVPGVSLENVLPVLEAAGFKEKNGGITTVIDPAGNASEALLFVTSKKLEPKLARLLNVEDCSHIGNQLELVIYISRQEGKPVITEYHCGISGFEYDYFYPEEFEQDQSDARLRVMNHVGEGYAKISESGIGNYSLFVETRTNTIYLKAHGKRYALNLGYEYPYPDIAPEFAAISRDGKRIGFYQLEGSSGGAVEYLFTFKDGVFVFE